jgi:hypothetical protein
MNSAAAAVFAQAFKKPTDHKMAQIEALANLNDGQDVPAVVPALKLGGVASPLKLGGGKAKKAPVKKTMEQHKEVALAKNEKLTNGSGKNASHLTNLLSAVNKASPADRKQIGELLLAELCPKQLEGSDGWSQASFNTGGALGPMKGRTPDMASDEKSTLDMAYDVAVSLKGCPEYTSVVETIPETSVFGFVAKDFDALVNPKKPKDPKQPMPESKVLPFGARFAWLCFQAANLPDQEGAKHIAKVVLLHADRDELRKTALALVRKVVINRLLEELLSDDDNFELCARVVGYLLNEAVSKHKFTK